VTRRYHVLGVPLRAGSLYPGSENDAQAYRDVGLVARLERAGRRVVDDGDVAIPSYLPHHAIPPIRSWPGPRIAWDCVGERVAPLLAQGAVPLLVGCDCSIVVGTTQALMRSAMPDVQVIYIDGDFDDAAPHPARCQSAAATAVWLLTHDSPFWNGPPLQPSQVSVVGWSSPSASGGRTRSVSLAELRRSGSREAAWRILEAIPASASILVHLDVDVLQKSEMPAAYFPHDEGLRLAELAELLQVILPDPRVRLVEVSEYASLRDLDQRHVASLADVLAGALPA
jgi:arginase